jgi:hypothetical protein
MAMMTSPVPISRIIGLAKNYGRGAGRYMAGNAKLAGIGAGVGAGASLATGDNNMARDVAAGAVGSAVAFGAMGKVARRGLESGGVAKAGSGMLRMLRILGK